MNLQSDIRSISYVKSNAAEMLRQVNDSHSPIVITQNGEAKAVLLDTVSYQEMKDALGFLKLISQSENDAAYRIDAGIRQLEEQSRPNGFSFWR